MSSTLLLIRHSVTSFNNVYLGHEDPPLSEEGVQLLKNYGVEPGNWKVYSSPLRRAAQTAEILFETQKDTITYDDRLKEINFGQWGGKTYEQIQSGWPEPAKQWQNSFHDFCFPGGESVEKFIGRIESFLSDFLDKEPADTALVCHGGVIRFILCRLLRIPYESHLAFNIQRPSINVIDLQGEVGTLTFLNLKKFPAAFTG